MGMSFPPDPATDPAYYFDNDYWLLDQETGPNERELLQLDCPNAPRSIAVFTSEENAEAYRESFLTPQWDIGPMSCLALEDMFADLKECGVEFIVVNPCSEMPDRVLTIFQAMLELRSKE